MLRHSLSLLLFFLFSFYTTILLSQLKHLELDYRSSADGLSSDWVNSITEDSRGFIWLGSRVGLNIYDGKEFKSLFHRPEDSTTISGNDVSMVIYSKKDKIVAGTWGNGINIIDPVDHTVTKPIPDGIAENINTKSIVEDSDSTIWVGSLGQGVFKFDHKLNRLVPLKYYNEQGLLDTVSFLSCEAMCVHNDTVWLGSHTKGLAFVEKTTGTIKVYNHLNFNPNLISDVSYLSSNGGKLQIGTFSATYNELITETGELVYSRNISRDGNSAFRVISILNDNHGSIWVTSSEGIVKKMFNKNEFTFYDSHDDVVCSLQDSRGIIWFGNWKTGLSKYKETLNGFVEIDPGSVKSIFVNSLTAISDSSIFISTSKGLFLYDTRVNKAKAITLSTDVEELEKLASINILGTVKYNEDNFLALIEGLGFYVLDSEFKLTKYETPHNKISTTDEFSFVKRFDGSKIWIGTHINGICLHDIETGENSHFSNTEKELNYINSNYIYSTFLDKRDRKWICAENGVSILDNEHTSFTPLNINLSGKKDSIVWMKGVTSMAQDKDGYYWFSSSAGLVWYDLAKDSVNLLADESNLSGVTINNLIQYDNYLWGTTKDGIISINSATKKVKQYPHADGVLSNSIPASSVICEDQIYIGYINGLTSISPNNLSEKSILFKIYLDKFLVNSLDTDIFSQNNNLSKNDPIYLDYDENNITFLLSIIDFRKSKYNAYSHQLIGFDKQPVIHDSQDKRISYTNLNPGKYQLVISNIDSENPEYVFEKTLFFKIERPFWEKWWFIVSAILLTIGLIYLVIKYRTYSINKKNVELTRYAEQQNAEIQNTNADLKEAYDVMAIKDKHLRSNVNYASKLQEALQPSSQEIASIFSNYFVYYKPRDVVSGDFYWSTSLGFKKIFVVSDCTGHGVSGAFMSVIGITFIKSIITGKGLTRPDIILDQLHNEVSNALRQETSDIKDGMDVSIICYNEETKELEIAGAYGLALIVPSEGEPSQLKSNRFPIGGTSKHYPNRKSYDLTTLTISDKTMVYLYSDGYQDQFDAHNEVKFMKKRFHKMLIENKDLPMSKQKEALDRQFKDWKQDTPQIDDVLVVGIELT